MINHKTGWSLWIAFSLWTLQISCAQNLFAKVKMPSDDPLAVVGSYANGCIFGAESLAGNGIGYQTMRQSRNRHFGHTDLVRYIEQLGEVMDQKGALLLIGDMSQPRGGLMSADHASHQLGLDVDIWLYPMTKATFKPQYVEGLKMRSVVNRGKGALNNHWDEAYFELIKTAATVANVDRIFINPVIKKALCARDENAPWQYKVRPWFGHDSHFHVRLKCPKDSPECLVQAPLSSKQSGCDVDLDNWINDQITITLFPKKTVKSGSIPKLRPKMPDACYQLVR